MCIELLILKFIHNFKILVTLLGENANNFTKLKQTSNKESFVDINKIQCEGNSLNFNIMSINVFLFTLDGVGT